MTLMGLRKCCTLWQWLEMSVDHCIRQLRAWIDILISAQSSPTTLLKLRLAEKIVLGNLAAVSVCPRVPLSQYPKLTVAFPHLLWGRQKWTKNAINWFRKSESNLSSSNAIYGLFCLSAMLCTSQHSRTHMELQYHQPIYKVEPAFCNFIILIFLFSSFEHEFFFFQIQVQLWGKRGKRSATGL